MAEIHWPKRDWWDVVPVSKEAQIAVEQDRARSRRIVKLWPDWTKNRAEFYFGGGTLSGIGIVRGYNGLGSLGAATGEVYKFQRSFVLLRAEVLAAGSAVTQAMLNTATKAAFPKYGTDGKWGGECKAEMNTFQRSVGLAVTDKPDPATVLKLNMKLTQKGIDYGVDYTSLIMEIGLIEPTKPTLPTVPVTQIPTTSDQLLDVSLWQKVKDKFSAFGWQKTALVGGAALVIAGIIAVIASGKK